MGGYRYNLRGNQVAFVGLNSFELLQGNYVKEKIAIQYEVIPNLYVSAPGNLALVKFIRLSGKLSGSDTGILIVQHVMKMKMKLARLSLMPWLMEM